MVAGTVFKGEAGKDKSGSPNVRWKEEELLRVFKEVADPALFSSFFFGFAAAPEDVTTNLGRSLFISYIYLGATLRHLIARG